MAEIHCFTSITFSYLNKARVLAWSLKRFHPEWKFWVCITDREPAGFKFDLKEEPFDEVVWGDEISIDNILGWLFKHNIIEVCTAVKGPMLKMLTETTARKILYLDPDIAVFGPLNALIEKLDHFDILLTPHQLSPEKEHQAIIDNEVGSLKHGIFNLGFLAINSSGEGRRFAEWWNDRLLSFCYDEIPSGLFVDQKWCDLVPALFDKVGILRDPGYNVASWNLSNRERRNG